MTDFFTAPLKRRDERILILALVIIALVCRTAFMEKAPNGWRDDELSNALVISQKVLDGDIRLYYPDASGHEGLYHWFQALSLAVFGENALGIRGVSIILGILSVVLLYLFAKRFLPWSLAAFSALVMATSYWSLLYSRTGHRHISAVVFSLITFLFLYRGVEIEERRLKWRYFILAGFGSGLSLYTYFAARGIPLILLAFFLYIFLWRRDIFRLNWRPYLLALGITLLIALPLIFVLIKQPGAETRVSEVALPIRDALDGDLSTLGKYAVTTLSMFTHNGDDEVLYNIPHRPVFSLLMGVLFWGGVLISAFRAFTKEKEVISGLILLWLFAGIAPGMLSVPAASLSHTILAKPVAYIFPAISLSWLGDQISSWKKSASLTSLIIGVALCLFAWESYRGIRDFFIIWPMDGFNRLHHHSALHESAGYLNTLSEPRDLAIAGLMSERWDQEAIRIDLDSPWRIREFDPNSALIFMPVGGLYVIPDYLEETWAVDNFLHEDQLGYHLFQLTGSEPSADITVRFSNGLTLIGIEILARDETDLSIQTFWQIDRALDLPSFPLYSKPPAPGEDTSPRLRVFVHLLTPSGAWAYGADALGVDPYTLQPGDRFIQRHVFSSEAIAGGCYTPSLGLYNPLTGERISRDDGAGDNYQPLINGESQLCFP